MKTIPLLAVLIVFLSLSITISYAGETNYQKHVANGIAGMEEKDYGHAADEFRAALNEKPDDPMSTLYLGIAFSRANNKDAEAVLVKALTYNFQEPRANLELGIYYFNHAIYDEAKDYFENTIKFAPDTDFSAKAEEYLRKIDKTGGPKRQWALNASIGEQYDSNVILGPEDGAVVSRKSDWRTIFYLKGRYNFLKKQDAEGSVGYGLYQSLHNRLHDFNVTQHMFEMKAARVLSPRLTLKGLYTYEYVYVGWDDYDYAHSISPSLIISEGSGLYTEIKYEYSRIHFQESESFPGNSDRTGRNNLIGITQNIPLNSFVSLNAGYSHDEETTRERFWGYRGNKLSAGTRFYLPRNIFIDLSGEYYNARYKDSSTASSGKREDNIYTAGISVIKALSGTYTVTAGGLYIRNDSNTDSYDYKRGITSVFINAKF
ncbi:MAG: hypothetical protein HY808_12565 [Nitrospirae bacterium]|nr:hypothetical protein [Nitrospirota bacterium]